ncbi:MAG: hypothetical protein E7187_08460, partial [Erysipelotrichaceae bacterium]|nr:hypothetical protein [Erysipelotrichaceae bacterium]
KEKALTKGIEGIKKDYDYILIDCPPVYCKDEFQ